MNIQTEHLENHIAQLTVEVDPDRMQKAKIKAARKLAKRVNIPGFRKGKAPYRILSQYIGEAAIIEEAIDELGQEIYRESLQQSEIEPYGPGNFIDFKLEPTPVFIYTVPKMPTVELNDYREVREDYEEPVISDEDVDKEIELLRQEKAVVEDIEDENATVEIGNRLIVDIESYFVDEDDDEEDETDGDEADEDDDEDIDDSPEPYAEREGLEIDLKEGDEEPLAPGFAKEMVGAKVGELRVFDITFPEDEESVNADLAGRTVHFSVIVKKIQTVTLPELNDEFAAEFTDQFGDAPVEEEAEVETTAVEEGEEGESNESAEPAEAPKLTMEQLRAKVREMLETNAKEQQLNDFANDVLDKMVERATLSYPEDAIEDQISSMIESFEQQLQQQGMDLDLYKSVTDTSDDDLREQYRETAERALARSLVFSEIVMKEHIHLHQEDIDEHIDKLIAQFGGGAQADVIRQTFNNPSFRNNIVNRLIQDKTFERIADIAKGTAPSLEEVEHHQEHEHGEHDHDDEEADESKEAEAQTVETADEGEKTAPEATEAVDNTDSETDEAAE